MKQEIVYLAIGSNVGDREKNILASIGLLKDKVSEIMPSKLYETKAVGYTEQSNFLNVVIRGETSLSPHELLVYIKRIEKEVGRIDRFRWGPREVDIDIIFYGNNIYEEEGLTIPHPRMHERDFVLRPLNDLDHNLKHPILGKTVKQMLDELPEDQRSILKDRDF